jgi:hypothetical protein
MPGISRTAFVRRGATLVIAVPRAAENGLRGDDRERDDCAEVMLAAMREV